ncbi:MAG: alpha/beta hydrolase [Pseudomonadota bacterium]
MKKPNDQMQAVLDVHKEMGPLPIESLTGEQARQIPLLDRAAVGVYGHSLMKKAMAPLPPNVGKVENKILPHNLMVRVYTPKGDMPRGGWPGLVYFHGGGWVIATLDTYDSSCRALCLGAECVVVSAHYRQAPEHPWPAAIEDAFAAHEWVVQNAGQLGIDGTRIAIGGESAGGNLATVTALAARDKGAPLPVHQVLVYPVTDLLAGFNSPSAIENKNAKPLNQAMLSWFYDKYVPEGADRSDPSISPLYAKLEGLPPTTIILAEIDPLRTDGEVYARKLEEAGVAVNLKCYEGVTHEFFGLGGLVSEANKAVAEVSADLRKAFGNETMMQRLSA